VNAQLASRECAHTLFSAPRLCRLLPRAQLRSSSMRSPGLGSAGNGTAQGPLLTLSADLVLHMQTLVSRHVVFD